MPKHLMTPVAAAAALISAGIVLYASASHAHSARRPDHKSEMTTDSALPARPADPFSAPSSNDPANPLGSADPTGPAGFQNTVLSEKWLKLIAGEVNGYAAFNNLAVIATYHRTLGSDDTRESLERIAKKCRTYGLPSVEFLRVSVKTGHEFFGLQDFDGQVPTRVRGAELRLVKPEARLITTTESAPSALIQGSRSADLTAPLIDIGPGADPKNYEGKDVRGKVVLAGNALPDDVKEMAIHRHGAAGVLFYFDLPHNSGDNQDANLDCHWSPWGNNGQPSTFGFSLSNNQYRYLKRLLDSGEKVVVKVKVDAEIKQGEEAVFDTLDAAIPGADFPDEEFLLWAHIDHAMPGAVDNASGCSVVLEVARTLQALIANGLVPRPKRTIRFLWLPHVTGLYMYLSKHPEKIGKIRGGISIDSVGISQTVFSNYFSASKPSHALPSYWTAVLENLAAVLDARANRNLLDYGNAEAIVSPEGSRDQLQMKVTPYNGFGDEMQSNNNTVRIPTIAFGCLPVPPRHSQVNFLSYIDPTGLQRTAYLGAALAAVFGWTDGESVGRLINEVFEAGRGHLIRESGLALDAVAGADQGQIDEAYKKSQILLRCGLARERAMLDSIRPLVPGDKKTEALIVGRGDEETALGRELSDGLAKEYAGRCRDLGVARRAPSPTPEERELDGLVPKPVPGIMGTSAYFGNYYEKVLGKEKLASFKLNPNFAYGIVGYTEAQNFIDGRRSILEIWEAVQSELWSEGYPAEHGVTMAEVAAYARMLEAAGVITIEKKRS
jgi:aminopeptidase YwaD